MRLRFSYLYSVNVRMKKILVLLFCLLSANSFASHIVGGEFELKHIEGNRYKLTLFLYFDAINGAFGAKEEFITARIFRLSDNFIMMTPQLPLIDEQPVAYTQPECSEGGVIKTDRLIYSAEITLSDEAFDDPEGYYVAWERCCRNYSILNIYSEDPNGPGYNGNFAGQTFYLQFPPVVKNGESFINSTPSLFPPLNDYACPNREYYVDFAGTDEDGDSLSYSLVEPLNTFAATAGTIPGELTNAGPYPSVVWRPGYSLDNITDGNPDLSISATGFIRVVPPPMSGLYVFAVKCEEFRDGEKIGEVRRDFQMFVVDECPIATPPKIEGKSTQTPSYVPTLNFTIPYTATGDDRCIEVKVTDEDIFRPEDNFSEDVKIRAVPIDFKGDISDILPETTSATLSDEQAAGFFKICFDECPFDSDGHSRIGIVVYDDACSLPLTDTLIVNIYIEPKPNADAYFNNSDVHEIVAEGSEPITWVIEGLDDDNDSLEVTSITNFALADFGFELRDSINTDGRYVSKLQWTPDCQKYAFGSKRDYEISFIVNDIECGFNSSDTVVFDLALSLPENNQPLLTVTSAEPSIEIINQATVVKANTPIHFLVKGSDNDPAKHNEIFLEMIDSAGTTIPDGFTFNPIKGVANVVSPFKWQPTCDIFTNNQYENDYTFTFRVTDLSCTTPLSDTLALKIKVKDVESNPDEFLPPNIITPNGDGLNDFFGLDDLEMTDRTEYLPKLPLDNCAGRFLNIRIFNRWGREVFESDKRNFRWFPHDQAMGMYFYSIQYTNTEYKGVLTLRD